MADTKRMFIDLFSRWQGQGMRAAARDIDRVDRSATDAGDSLDRMGDRSDDLDARIRHLRGSVQALGADFATMGEGADRDALGKRLRKERSFLSELRRIDKERRGSRVPSVRSPGPGWLGSGVDFSQGKGELRGVLYFALGEAIALAAPAIGAMVGGAVVGAVGSGGIVGGLVAGAKDPQARQAWRDFAASIGADDFGSAAFAGPSMGAARELRSAFHDMDIGGALEPLAPYAEMLTRGLGEFGTELMDEGLADMFAKAGPYIEVMAEELPILGQSLGYMFDKMSEGQGTVEGLQALFGLLNATARGLGNVVDWLGDRFYDMTTATIWLTGWLEDFVGLLSPVLLPLRGLFGMVNDDAEDFRAQAVALGAGVSGANQELDPFAGYLLAAGEAAGEAGGELDDLSMSIDKMFNKLMGADEAAIAWERALDDLGEAIAKNGKSLDIHTEKGRANVGAVNEMIQAAFAIRDADLALHHDTERANRDYEARIQRIKWHAEALRLDKEAVEAIVGKYEVAIVYTVQGLVGKGMRFNPNSAAALGAADAARNTLPMFPNVRTYSSGGETPAFAPFRVHDREVLFSSRQHYVATAAQARALEGGGGGGNITVTFAPSGDPLVDAIMDHLRDRVRVQHGGDAQAAFGRSSR